MLLPLIFSLLLVGGSKALPIESVLYDEPTDGKFYEEFEEATPDDWQTDDEVHVDPPQAVQPTEEIDDEFDDADTTLESDPTTSDAGPSSHPTMIENCNPPSDPTMIENCNPPSDPTTSDATPPSDPTTSDATPPSDPTTSDATLPSDPTTSDHTPPSDPTTSDSTPSSDPTTSDLTPASDPTTSDPTPPSAATTTSVPTAVTDATQFTFTSTTLLNPTTASARTTPSDPTTTANPRRRLFDPTDYFNPVAIPSSAHWPTYPPIVEPRFPFDSLFEAGTSPASPPPMPSLQPMPLRPSMTFATPVVQAVPRIAYKLTPYIVWQPVIQMKEVAPLPYFEHISTTPAQSPFMPVSFADRFSPQMSLQLSKYVTLDQLSMSYLEQADTN